MEGDEVIEDDAAQKAVRVSREQLTFWLRVFSATCVRSESTLAEKQALLAECIAKRA
jgi:hypothetical protein